MPKIKLNRSDAEELMQKHAPLLPVFVSPARPSSASVHLQNNRFMLSPTVRIESLTQIITKKLNSVGKVTNVSVFLFLKHEERKIIIGPGYTIGELAMNQKNRPNGWIEILYHNQETF